MALISRVSRLFKADFHAVLDQIEEPEQLLKQAIREMEDSIAVSEQRIRAARHDQDVMIRRLAVLEESLPDVQSEIDLCFDSGKTELARNLIRKKLEVEKICRRLQQQIESNDNDLGDQQTLLDENRGTLDGLRQKAELFARRTPPGAAGDSQSGVFDWAERDLRVSDDEVEIRVAA